MLKQITNTMAVEKDKVIGRFKSLFGTIGLSNTRLDEISAKLGAKLNDDASDEDIDARLNELNEIYPFSEIKKNDDRTLNDKKNPNRNPQPKPEPKAEPQPKDDDDPLAQILGVVKNLQTEITTLKSERTAQTISERFKADDRIKSLKGVQDHMFKGRVPQTEEEYETAVEEFVQDWKPFLEKNIIQDQKDVTPPSGAGGTGGKTKQISADDAKAAVAAMGSF